MHPEVKYIGLVTLLYAGIASLYNSKYSINNDIVKKLELRSQSAGNISKFESGTSETLRNGIVINTEHIKEISDHVPKHIKPLNNEQLGHYLAGLIDGDGHFSKIQQLVIVFSHSDAFLAYYIKEKLGYGKVKKVKDKNAYLLVVSNKQGIINVLNLVNGKLRAKHRFDQVTNNILSNSNYKLDGNFTMNISDNFDNHWLAGFSDADASFQVKTIERVTRSKPSLSSHPKAIRSMKEGCSAAEIRLHYQVDQESDLILKMIQSYLGGNIGYRKTQDTYYYGSTSFGSARKVIHYFDKFHLQSRKHISYLRWRKVYHLIQNREHLTEKGLAKIMKIKALINHHD